MSQPEASSSVVCAECGGTGWLHVRRSGTEGVVRCPCQKDGQSQRLLSNAKIPGRYIHCSLESFALRPRMTNQSHEKAKIAAEKYVKEYPPPTPWGLLFMGPQGVGK